MESLCDKEKCQHGSIQVPYSYYDCGIPDYFYHVPAALAQ